MKGLVAHIGLLQRPYSLNDEVYGRRNSLDFWAGYSLISTIQERELIEGLSLVCTVNRKRYELCHTEGLF